MLSVTIEKRLGNFLLKTDFETEEPITGLLGAYRLRKSLTLKCIAGWSSRTGAESFWTASSYLTLTQAYACLLKSARWAICFKAALSFPT